MGSKESPCSSWLCSGPKGQRTFQLRVHHGLQSCAPIVVTVWCRIVGRDRQQRAAEYPDLGEPAVEGPGLHRGHARRQRPTRQLQLVLCETGMRPQAMVPQGLHVLRQQCFQPHHRTHWSARAALPLQAGTAPVLHGCRASSSRQCCCRAGEATATAMQQPSVGCKKEHCRCSGLAAERDQLKLYHERAACRLPRHQSSALFRVSLLKQHNYTKHFHTPGYAFLIFLMHWHNTSDT
mmetsp:Transcript_125660/g.250763  ORF Transcript_125660/g.250763 Transcript_125660/m.250763 type:complete len:236 (+) Transcript_125660:1258-1965(+)